MCLLNTSYRLKMINRKKILRIVGEIAIIIILVIGFVLINEQVSENNRNSFKAISDSNNFAYEIEEVNVTQDIVEIKGWFIRLKKVRNKEKEVFEDNNPSILLCSLNEKTEMDIDGNEKAHSGFGMKTKTYNREDVNEYFKCEYDYSLCGFTAQIERYKLDIENTVYQLVYKEEENGINGLPLDAYIVNGTLAYVNPSDIFLLDVRETDLEDVVYEGTCLVSDPQLHICIYQLERKLYWIVDEKYNFENEDNTKIQFIVETTQFDKLPQNRIDRGLYWDDIGEPFKANEKTDMMECGKYRVSVRELPSQYSITRILTGQYTDGKWTWQKAFRPQYSFK